MKFVLALLVAAPMFAQSPVPVTPPTGKVTTPDVAIAYWVYGKPTAAVPMIAVNGGPGLSHVYMMQNDLWPRVAKAREVVVYDQRGTGASPLTNAAAPMGMDAQVADLEALRAALKFEKFDLLGDSYGGLLAMAYTAAHPEHVRKLVLSDSAAPAWKAIDHLFPDVFPDKVAPKPADPKHPTQAESDAGLRFHFELIFYSQENLDRYMKTYAKDIGNFPAAGAAVFAATRELDLTAALPKFTCPTMVITGRYDMNVAPLTAWKIAQAIPGAKFVPFEKSGHLPAYEEEDKYFRVLTEFLDAK